MQAVKINKQVVATPGHVVLFFSPLPIFGYRPKGVVIGTGPTLDFAVSDCQAALDEDIYAAWDCGELPPGFIAVAAIDEPVELPIIYGNARLVDVRPLYEGDPNGNVEA